MIDVIRALIHIIVSQEEDFAKLNHRLDHINERINHMDKNFTAFANSVSATFDDFGTKVDELTTSLNGLAGDIKAQADLIAQLQASGRAVTAEDQALIDGIDAKGKSAAARLTTVSDGLKALDAVTPPTPPTT